MPSALKSLRRSSPIPKKSSPKDLVLERNQAIKITQKQTSISSSIISIKETLLKDEKSKNELRKEDLPREVLHIDHIKMYWKQYAFQLKEDGMETFYNALIKRDPILISDETIELTVDNLVQFNYINTHLITFKDFMRKQLNNHFLDIVLVQAPPSENDDKFLTGKDKFAAMAKKNPELNTLKNRFNLDIDY